MGMEHPRQIKQKGSMWDMSKSKLVEAQAEWTHRKRED